LEICATMAAQARPCGDVFSDEQEAHDNQNCAEVLLDLYERADVTGRYWCLIDELLQHSRRADGRPPFQAFLYFARPDRRQRTELAGVQPFSCRQGRAPQPTKRRGS
jgi:hypothetical protein